MPAISVINNLLKYGLNELKLRFRTRLSRHLYQQYMEGFTFYKMSNIDNRIANADQLLTQDVEKLCESMVDVYSNLTKPLLDMVLYIVRLSSAIGFQAPGSILAYLVVSGIFLTWLRRPIGRMTVVEQQLEGELRFVNSRLITNSEEIAFYQGNARERRTIFQAFDRLVAHLRKLLLFRFSVGFVDNIVAKYIATMVGFVAVSRPFFTESPLLKGLSRSELMEEYYRSGRMMVKLAEAVGRLALAGRELTRLSGFTARVTELTEVLQDLNRGRYVRTMVSSPSNKVLKELDGPANVATGPQQLVPGSGQLVTEDNVIRFENVPLVTPNGDVLIQSLDFEVRSGMNVLVCGPNGCGKSSLFRTLGELWPLFGGTLTKPDKSNLFYIPQRPYMTLGTLRDQIIYPDSPAKMALKGITDEKLVEYLGLVQLEYILAREGGWESVQDWMDVLSGGEKQRVAMARLFYHKPQFAILDECTSAVSVDVEGEMYQWCRGAGITLFTVSHRKSLWKHHEFYLHMDGRGAYDFKPIEDSTIEFGS